VASDQLDALGIHWPEQVEFGVPGLTGSVEWSARSGFRATIANPVIAATLRGSAGTANLLANPKIRVRNRDKARVHIGQKLPVFTTMATPNVGVSASVTYLDVGLKLDVEPTVGLDNAVSIRVGLEVSNVLRQVTGPAGSIAYEVGTRLTNTSLRLADGETQIISGLVNDEDRRSASGVPGLVRAPVVGPLFGLNSSTRNKTEVVLLITPRIVRNLSLPDIGVTRVPAGTDAYPGAFSSQLRPALPSKPVEVPAKP
jgi:general secretion pathway protein D